MKDFAGKVVVITGAADGIGKALAAAFAAERARLVLADIGVDRLSVTCDELTRDGVEAIAVPTDVSDAAAVAALRDAAVTRFGAVHVLCNNAGVMGPAGDPLWDLPLEEWRRVLSVNLWGVLNGIRAFLPGMLASGDEGHVLTTASMAGMTSSPLIPEYVVSKHAAVALTESLHAQLSARNAPIGVTIVCPSAVSTDLAAREHERLAATQTGNDWARALGGGQHEWAGAISPATVASAALHGIRDNRLFVFTHADSRRRVDDRLRPILGALDDFDRDMGLAQRSSL